MEYDHYLKTEYSCSYQELANEIMKNLKNAPALIDRLAESRKYQENFEFRTTVETGRSLYHKMKGEQSEVLALSENLVEQASALELWDLVSANLNLIGNTYFAMGLYERVLEVYHRAVRNEEAHGRGRMISLLYNNLAVLFVNMDDYEKAYEYQLLAIEALDRNMKGSPRYLSNLVIYHSNLVIYMCEIGKFDEVPPVLRRMEESELSEISPEALSTYYLAQMYYAFYSKDREQGREYYMKSVAEIPEENLYSRAVVLHGYLNLHEKLKYDLSLCEEEIRQMETLQNDGNAFLSVEILGMLRGYYQTVGDRERFEGTTTEYIRYLEEDSRTVRSRQLTAMRIVEDLVQSKEDMEDMSSRNTELRLIAEEAVRNKNALQSAYEKIEMIGELGRKLTSSLDLSSVVALIRRNLRNNVPAGTFVLVIAEPEIQRLRSVVHCNGNRVREEFSVEMSDRNSLFAECYRQNEILVFHDLEAERREGGHEVLTVGEGKDVHSAIFMPMEVDGRVIGVCSLQSGGKDLYREEHIEFLKALLPYLSIAMNNAMHSLQLKKEMEVRLEAQKKLEEANRKLEEANRKLERLSLMDGLTRIGNRRDFEARIIELLEDSSARNESVAVIMLDIDNFKKYNDTYGHLQGDEALKNVAQVIRDNLDRVQGLSARFGGEEFIGACAGRDADEVKQLADKIRKDVYDRNIEHRDAELQRLTVSVGIAFAEKADASWKSMLMRWADISLYRAKTEGKNRTVVKRVEADERIPGMSD